MAHPVLRSSMDSPNIIVFVPSKHDETLIHLPKAITESGSCTGVRAAVIAHPWGMLGGNMYDHVVQEMFDLFANAGILVATYNSRGSGKSGGRGSGIIPFKLTNKVSAQTETEDYESVLTRLMSYAKDKSIPITNLYICGYSYGSLIASLVPPPVTETNYILISPLLSPIANLTTFFTASTQRGILSKHSSETYSSSVQRILVIYGSGDIFAFSTRRYRRFFTTVSRDWRDKARIVEVEGGGHFWMDARGKEALFGEINAFIA